MRITAILSLIALAACQQEQSVTSLPEGPDLCKAASYQHLVGTSAEAADFSAAPSLRIIGPDMAVTMDFRPDRLNIETDASGIITRIRCG